VSYVYVSNAEDGDIGLYRLGADGSLEAGARFKAEKTVAPTSVSPDKRFLVAAARTKPYTAYAYAIDRASGALELLGTAPLAESFPYITHDRSGRWLLGASYSAHLVSVNPIGADGRVGEPAQVIATGRNAHAIIVDRSNHFAFVPHLGTDQVFQFLFDEKSGRLTANTPPLLQLRAGTGPRHLVVSPDNRFVFLLNELTATVSTLELKSGILKEIHSVAALPPGNKLRPGLPRPQQGRDVSADVWASDIQLTPDGRFLYAAERTGSTISAFAVNAGSGRPTYLDSIATEKQPRGFRIDPTGRFMVVSGEKSETISSYAIEADGRLRLIGRYPTGKGSNWVEIVAF
jgi:6-phosphogluconolactonase